MKLWKKWWFWVLIVLLIILFVPMIKVCTNFDYVGVFCRFDSLAELIYRSIFRTTAKVDLP